MDKIYFVEDNPPDRMNYANELSEFDHDVTSVSRSLLLELMDKNTVKGVEKRAHKRFQVNKDAVALIRPAAAEQLRVADKSMAEIACTVYRSKPIKFGRINNISMGGLSFRYIPHREDLKNSSELNISTRDTSFSLEKMPFKSVSDSEIADESSSSYALKRHGVQFGVLTPSQISQLDYFIQNHTFGEV